MIEQKMETRKITKKSSILDAAFALSKGASVVLEGIVSESQAESGVIESFEVNERVFRVLTRVSHEVIERGVYFTAKDGLRKAKNAKSYQKGSVEYEEYDAKLREAGL